MLVKNLVYAQQLILSHMYLAGVGNCVRPKTAKLNEQHSVPGVCTPNSAKSCFSLKYRRGLIKQIADCFAERGCAKYWEVRHRRNPEIVSLLLESGTQISLPRAPAPIYNRRLNACAGYFLFFAKETTRVCFSRFVSSPMRAPHQRFKKRAQTQIIIGGVKLRKRGKNVFR